MPERSKGVDLKSSGLRPREFESRSGRFGAALRYTCTSGGTRRGRHHWILPGHGAAEYGGQLGFRFESAGQADVHAARSARAQDSLVMVPLSVCEIWYKEEGFLHPKSSANGLKYWSEQRRKIEAKDVINYKYKCTITFNISPR